LLQARNNPENQGDALSAQPSHPLRSFRFFAVVIFPYDLEQHVFPTAIASFGYEAVTFSSSYRVLMRVTLFTSYTCRFDGGSQQYLRFDPYPDFYRKTCPAMDGGQAHKSRRPHPTARPNK
jgi:hypothetical protein